MKLFVDDTRKFPKTGFQCCRDFDSAVMLLGIMDFEYISLDYSLGQGEPNGLDILKWMKEHNIFVPRINIHSNHFYGRDAMYDFCAENFPHSIVSLVMLDK